ncbi:MAG: dinitrogenase iron-molybdenum cofactor biosynthesis protein [Chloroflexi bacterium]|nr:dinitrogenase iron-molybdenum cofactor biosynthesis protein [Chloroflexota bacterium]
MKIAISTAGANLDAEVDPRFGRCEHFIIVDPETMKFEVMENSSVMASSGAGISAAQMIADEGVQVVLTGSCGPNAYQVLSSDGIKVVTGVSGKVRDAIESYKSGKLRTSSQPNVPGHFGMGVGRGFGRGRGMGRGCGIMPQAGPLGQPLSQEQELEALKAQTKVLTRQLTDIQRRVEKLEKKK